VENSAFLHAGVAMPSAGPTFAAGPVDRYIRQVDGSDAPRAPRRPG
jgi:hypothetical protein